MKRSPHGEPLRHWHITLPESLANRVDLLLIDPLSGRVKYGSRSGLVERLLREHLDAGAARRRNK